MPNHVLPRAATTTRLHDALKAAFGPIPFGLGSIPRVGNVATAALATAPYGILLPLWSNLSGPAWGQDRHADVEWIYQVDLYSVRVDQLEGMRDKAFATILGKTATGWLHDLDTPAAHIMERELREDDGIDAAIGSTLPSQLRFALLATPADALVDD
jgi:hypothetical protein